MNQLVTRWPGGFTNAAPGSFAGDLKIDRPWTYFQQFSDFAQFVAADWVITGGASQAVTAAANGVLALVNTAANGDETNLQWAGGSGAVKPLFQWSATKDFLFFARVALDSVLNSGMLLGFAGTDTTPIASLPTSGMFVYKPPASLFPQGYARQGGVGTLTAQSQTPMVDNTMTWVSIQYIAAEGVCRMFVGDAGFRLPAPLSMPTGLIAPTIALSNGTAAARTLSVDAYYAAVER